MTVTTVIVGGDAAGMSAASKIKRQTPDAEVIVFERSHHISYSACGMPYWISGTIESDDDLLVLTPQQAREKRGIDVRMRHEVTAIDPVRQTVDVRDLDGDQLFFQDYDKLVIATGASPTRPPISGLDLPGVFSLRAFADSQRIQRFIDENDPKRAVIIGAGYIGLEMAEALHARGMKVAVVEMLSQIMPNFDADMVEEVSDHLAEKGVELHLGTRVNGIERHDGALSIASDAGDLAADLVLVSTGVRPNSQLAEAAGLDLGATRAIRVDDHMRTSDPHIYAAGDCVEHRHLVTGDNVWIPLAPSANKGGRIAGDNVSGGDSALPGILGTAVVKIFDYTMSITGLTERQAIDSGHYGLEGEAVGSAIVNAFERPHYWPGAVKMKVKLVFDRTTGNILGAQLLGTKGVNKRIDIIVAAITGGLTLDDLALMDMSYAPPYSAVYDPLQICANVAMKQVAQTANVA